MRKIAIAIQEDEMAEIIIVVRNEINSTHTPKVRGVVIRVREIEREMIISGIKFNIMLILVN